MAWSAAWPCTAGWKEIVKGETIDDPTGVPLRRYVTLDIF